MGTLLTLRNWLMLAVLWAGFVAFLAWQSWPRIPFDMANDAATREALQSAITFHIAAHAGLAIGPPLAILALGWIVNKLRG